MRCLFCCEFYYPSRGGVQEVMRQISERLVAAGHEVTVATTKLAERDFTELNGVRLIEFSVAGNFVRGLTGEVDRYREFLKEFPADVILIKAAQQWTFDASLDILDDLSARKVFVPCGFSGLHEPRYEKYFEAMPDALRKFDQLIFYAERYRDIDFAKAHNIENFTIIPNGASETEFGVPRDPTFRKRHGIGADDTLLLTVGSPISNKGHTVLAAAYSLLSPTSDARQLTLILNGDWPAPVGVDANGAELCYDNGERVLRNAYSYVATVAYWNARKIAARAASGVSEFRQMFRKHTPNKKLKQAARRFVNPNGLPIEYWIHAARVQPEKRVLKTYFSREETVQAFLNADLFVFASMVEYSPLVLYEAAAAGLPFLTVPVGNAEEIARWTGAGVVCPAFKDARGYARAEPSVLARHIEEILGNPKRLQELGIAGRRSFEQRFNWGTIAKQYEAVLEGKPIEG